MSAMLDSLKDYVRKPTSQNQADDTVLMHVTHGNLKQRFLEIRFDLHTTIEAIKERLRDRSGTSVESMYLQLYDEANHKICDLLDDFRPLGFYSPLDGYHIHIIDRDPTSLSAGGWLEDTSLVDKYNISDDAYNNRKDTFRKYREKQLAEDPTWTLAKDLVDLPMLCCPSLQLNVLRLLVTFSDGEDVASLLWEQEMARRKNEPYVAPLEVTDDHMVDIAVSIKVGDRCEVDPGGKRGQVKYVGKAETLAAGYWVGVQYDEPVGKHDGIVKGRRYFTCPQGHGAMLRPDKVKVGDFPERDPFEDDLEEI